MRNVRLKTLNAEYLQRCVSFVAEGLPLPRIYSLPAVRECEPYRGIICLDGNYSYFCTMRACVFGRGWTDRPL